MTEAALKNVIQQDISHRLTESFLPYSMYVISDRALPDIRTGTKPVQRRILYSMHCLGLEYNKPHRKSAKTVGDVLSRTHPHGDASVYDAMVTMAQEFTMRYPLIDIHGNRGSVDGDQAAASRYTEARLSYVGSLMLRDLEKNTVDMILNYDESEQEPASLPNFFPNLLANGSSGIAVGMGTSIPPHNATELYTALQLMLSNELDGKETSVDDLIKIVKAPDFPTGGTIIDLKEIEQAYRTGKGRVLIRSKYHIEENKGREAIIITEIPYKVNKAKLVEKIAALVRDKTIDGIFDLRDESDKDGIRIAIDLKKDANSAWIIKKLLKHTEMQTSYSMNFVTLNNRVPMQFNLKEGLEAFLLHVADIIMRRTTFDLEKADRRRHIVEGLLICLDKIDEVIAVIRAAKSNQQVVASLMQEFSLSEEQAKAIADMRLKALSSASQEELKTELEKLMADISHYQSILNDQSVLLKVMQAELKEVAKHFENDKRVTEIKIDSNGDIDDRDLIKDETLIVTMTSRGIIKSVSESEYSTKGRRTKGVKAGTIKEDESVKYMLTVNSRDDLLFFTNTGRCHVIEVYKIPVATKASIGKYINNYITLEPDERIVSMLSMTPKTKGDLFFVTKNGFGKRLALDQLSKRMVTRVLSFKDNDELVSCVLMKANQEVMIVTANGQGIRFNPDNETKGIRKTGRGASGVIILNLKDYDYVVDAIVNDDVEAFLLITEKGFSKRCEVADVREVHRGGKGVRVWGVTEKTGLVVGMLAVKDEDELFIASKNGLVSRISVDSIRVMGRGAQGVRTINLAEDDIVVSISKFTTETEEAEGE